MPKLYQAACEARFGRCEQIPCLLYGDWRNYGIRRSGIVFASAWYDRWWRHRHLQTHVALHTRAFWITAVHFELAAHAAVFSVDPQAHAASGASRFVCLFRLSHYSVSFNGSEWPPGSMRSGRGICIGLGAGLAARHRGLLDSLRVNESDDGRPSSLLLTHRKIPLIQIVMLCNGLLLITAGFVLGWEPALYSALSCLAAYETTRLMFIGLTRMVCVVSKDQQTVEEALYRRLRIHSTPVGSPAQIDGKVKDDPDDEKDEQVIVYS